MRHRLSGRQLSRNAPHRRAMLRNMAASLLRHETIRTTLPKAKELRRVVEPLITLARTDGVARRRQAYDRLRDREIVGKLFSDIGPRFAQRPGGYTRILKLGTRPGDAAEMAVIQLVERATPASPAAVEEVEPRPARRKAGKKTAKKAEAEAAAEPAARKRKKAAARKRPAAKKKPAKKKATKKSD